VANFSGIPFIKHKTVFKTTVFEKFENIRKYSKTDLNCNSLNFLLLGFSTNPVLWDPYISKFPIFEKSENDFPPFFRKIILQNFSSMFLFCY